MNSKQPLTYAQLSKSITLWTSNLLATCFVLVVCLALGGYFLDWGNGQDRAPSSAKPNSQQATLPTPWFDSPDMLAFGASSSFSRRSYSGKQEDVLEWMLAFCQQAAISATAFSNEPQEAERRLLAMTANRTPHKQQAGAWRLHHFPGVFPLVVSVCWRQQKAIPIVQGQPSSPPRRRLAAWCMAVPAGGERWSIYLFRSTGAPKTEQPNQLAKIPLPPGARQTLHLTSMDGGAMLGFSGESSVRDWQAHFQKTLVEFGCQLSLPWSEREGVWHARFQKTSSQNPAALAFMVDVVFSGEDQVKLLGLLTITQTPSEEK